MRAITDKLVVYSPAAGRELLTRHWYMQHSREEGAFNLYYGQFATPDVRYIALQIFGLCTKGSTEPDIVKRLQRLMRDDRHLNHCTDLRTWYRYTDAFRGAIGRVKTEAEWYDRGNQVMWSDSDTRCVGKCALDWVAHRISAGEVGQRVDEEIARIKKEHPDDQAL
ncbi:hypothetical protein D3C85_787790 [compost metagenome]